MVDKVRKFNGIPAKNKTLSVEADQWTQKGGLDPELTEPVTKDVKKYPHRLSLDLDTATYKRLKLKAFQEERSMNEVIRELIENNL